MRILIFGPHPPRGAADFLFDGEDGRSCDSARLPVIFPAPASVAAAAAPPSGASAAPRAAASRQNFVGPDMGDDPELES